VRVKDISIYSKSIIPNVTLQGAQDPSEHTTHPWRYSPYTSYPISYRYIVHQVNAPLILSPSLDPNLSWELRRLGHTDIRAQDEVTLLMYSSSGSAQRILQLFFYPISCSGHNIHKESITGRYHQDIVTNGTHRRHQSICLAPHYAQLLKDTNQF
jgi:hypothetical protein